MVRLVAAFVIMMVCGSTSYAANKKAVERQIEESMDAVASVYFEAGFTSGATCAFATIRYMQEQTDHGTATDEQELMKHLEKCQKGKRAQFQIKN